MPAAPELPQAIVGERPRATRTTLLSLCAVNGCYGVIGVTGCPAHLDQRETIRLLDISSTKSALVAAVGGKELFAPAPVRPPSPVRVVRSDVEIADDVQRRA